MSRISELEFYNDKDVISQIEWLKDHIGADHIKNITIEENTDPASPDFGKTKITMFMENGEYYEGSFTSALIKSVDSHQEGDEVVLEFHLATGETITARCKVIVHATASWDSLEGDPKSSVSLTEWMNTKTETTDFTNEVTARVQGDEKNAGAITALDKTLSDGIERIDGEIAQEITDRQQAENLKEDKANKVTAWSSELKDTNYPSEKLVRNSMLDIYKTNNYSKIEVLNNVSYGTVGGRLYGKDGSSTAFKSIEVIVYDRYLENLESNTVELASIADKPTNKDLIAIQTSFNGVRYKLEWVEEQSFTGYGLMATTLDGRNWDTDRVAGFAFHIRDGSE